MLKTFYVPLRLRWRSRQSLHLLLSNGASLPKRISGPMLDRFAIFTSKSRAPAPEAERSGVDFEKLSDNRQGEGSDEIRARVEAARQRQ